MSMQQIAQGQISRGGYVGPEIVVLAKVGFRTTVVDPRYVDGAAWDVRVSEVHPEWVGLEMKRHGLTAHFKRANPLFRLPGAGA